MHNPRPGRTAMHDRRDRHDRQQLECQQFKTERLWTGWSGCGPRVLSPSRQSGPVSSFPMATAQQPAAAAASSSSSNIPVRKECAIPGKTCWVLWRTTFEIDERYTPIKARPLGGRSGLGLLGGRRPPPGARTARGRRALPYWAPAGHRQGRLWRRVLGEAGPKWGEGGHQEGKRRGSIALADRGARGLRLL